MGLVVEPDLGGGEARSGAGVHSAHWGRLLVDNLSFQFDAMVKEMAETYTLCAGEGPHIERLVGLGASAATEQLLFFLRTISTGERIGAEAASELGGLRALAGELVAGGHGLGTVLEAVHGAVEVAWHKGLEELALLPAQGAAMVRPALEGAFLGVLAASTVAASEGCGDDRQVCLTPPPSFLDDALQGGDRLVSAGRKAELAGWSLAARHVVIVAAVERVEPMAPTLPWLAGDILARWERAGAQRHSATGTLRHGQIVMAVAGDGRASVIDPDLWRRRAAETPLPCGHRLLVGIGIAEEELAGIERSYRQARQALEAAGRRPGERVVVGYADIIPDLVLGLDNVVADDAARLVVGTLRRLAGGHVLLCSVEAYLDCGLNVMAAARHLGVHRHTLAARLDKVALETGLDVSRRTDRLVLELGLRAGLTRSC